MNSILSKRISEDAGTTLVEVIVTVVIAAVAISGLVTAYINGIDYLREGSDRVVMVNEGEAAMRVMSRWIHNAYFLDTQESWRSPSDELNLKSFDAKYEPNDRAEFYFYPSDNSLRWNEHSGGVGIFNQRLIPLYDYVDELNEAPYITVEEVTFTAIDPERPVDPSTEGYALIQIDLRLRGPKGEIVQLTNVVSKRNRLGS